MACSSCGKSSVATEPEQPVVETEVAAPYVTAPTQKRTAAKVVEASNTNEKVLLRYYGGGNGTIKTNGCRSCGGGNAKYSVITSERIRFASEDESNGYFNLLVSVGHDYWVTKSQADYMLTLTYRNAAGRTIHKFREV